MYLKKTEHWNMTRSREKEHKENWNERHCEERERGKESLPYDRTMHEYIRSKQHNDTKNSLWTWWEQNPEGKYPIFGYLMMLIEDTLLMKWTQIRWKWWKQLRERALQHHTCYVKGKDKGRGTLWPQNGPNWKSPCNHSYITFYTYFSRLTSFPTQTNHSGILSAVISLPTQYQCISITGEWVLLLWWWHLSTTEEWNYQGR